MRSDAVMKYLLLSFLLSRPVLAEGSYVPCDPTFTKLGFICRCNSSYCDMFPEIPTNESAVYHLITGENIPGYNLVLLEDTDSSLENAVEISVNLSVILNPNLLGFGGAFTDSFGFVLKKLSPKSQKLLLRSYFAPEGNRYNLCRMPIGVSDSSPAYYDYDSGSNDLSLCNVSLSQEDFEYKISVFREVLQMKRNKKLMLLGSNWSPPPWMKINNSTGPGYLRNEFYQLYTNYIIRFLKDYRKVGVKFWGITPINQGLTSIFGHTKLMSTIMFPHQQRKYVAQHLGPNLKNHGFGDLKIIINDDQRRFASWLMDEFIEDQVAYNFASGIGIHWYLDPVTPVEMMDDLHENYPDKFLLYTESSVGELLFGVKPAQGLWYCGMLYGNSIIEVGPEQIPRIITLDVIFQWGWMDWNMALDPEGGPNLNGFNSDSPIIVESEKDAFYKQPTFYVLGHFSALTEPGGKVLGTQIDIDCQKRTKRNYRPMPISPASGIVYPPLQEGIFTTAVSNPDGRIVVFILNTFKSSKNITLSINEMELEKKSIKLFISGSSMNSIIFFIDDTSEDNTIDGTPIWRESGEVINLLDDKCSHRMGIV